MNRLFWPVRVELVELLLLDDVLEEEVEVEGSVVEEEEGRPASKLMEERCRRKYVPPVASPMVLSALSVTLSSCWDRICAIFKPVEVGGWWYASYSRTRTACGFY